MTDNLPYHERLKLIKLGQLPKEAVAKPKKAINKISDKKRAEQKAAGDKDGLLDQFFEQMRKKMVGVCQCGCGEKSQKKDDTFFRHCICHIFPKRLFPSIATHPLNWVERTFWGGHHTNMDDRSIDLWTKFADWDDIKEKFHQLVPFLTDDERKTKFYHHLEKLIYETK